MLFSLRPRNSKFSFPPHQHSLYFDIYFSSTSKSRYLVLTFHVVLAIIYSCIHTVIFMLQAVTLNVAFNSQNKSLLTVMMSNNFVEIKSNVFRKYSKSNLYQVACYDAKERFHLVVMMGIVALRNMAQYQWSIEHLLNLLPDMMIVLICEVFVDWIKHCFISKFNETSADVYLELRTSLARHVLTASVVTGGADRQDTVANRTGLSLVPLVCLIIAVGMQVFRSTSFAMPDIFSIILWLCGIFILKSILGYMVISSARSIVMQATQRPSTANFTVQKSATRKSTGGGRSCSVEDVQFVHYKPVVHASLMALANNNNNNNNGNDKHETGKLEQRQEAVVPEFPDSHVTLQPAQLMALKREMPLNELRRVRSNVDLSTIYETPQTAATAIPTTAEKVPEGPINRRKTLFIPAGDSNVNQNVPPGDGLSSKKSE